MAASTTRAEFAYITLITRASYLAGVIILAQTLRKHGSKYPLIVLYTPALAEQAVKALQDESPKNNVILRSTTPLLPSKDKKTHLIAERFADTWTKLRVFEVFDFDQICYLDADMMLLGNMDTVFDSVRDLPSDWIAANHACVCNLDSDPWAPEDWTKDNCAYTPLKHPEALHNPLQPRDGSGRETYHLLNSGMFVYQPSPQLWDQMLDFFNSTPLLSTFKFPDQDFLAHFFRDRWRAIGWQWNALKTMRYWHENMWRDDSVVCLHYIVDKPWASRVSVDGQAGYKGRDGVTHRWWWEEYEEWTKVRTKDNAVEVLNIVSKNVASADGEEMDDDMKAIGAQVQAFAKNKASEDSK